MTALTEYRFICTKSTKPLSVKAFALNQADHQREVHNAFAAISQGFFRVAQIVTMPLPTPPEGGNFLLCDGTLLRIADYGELFAYLGTAYGGDGLTTFAIPDAVAGVTPAASAPAQTVTEGGSVIIGTPTPAPTPTGGQTGGSGQNVPSGGRPRNPFEAIP